MNPEPNLHRALHDLASVPGPVSLADQALRGAKRMRTRHRILTGLTAVAFSSVLVLPFTFFEPGPNANVAAVPAHASASVQKGPDPCAGATSIAPNLKEVAPENQPEYVRLTISKLPARTDYVMQSGSQGICPEGGAYSVINLGAAREHGHITVRLERAKPETPRTCAAVAAYEKPMQGPDPEILFCTENINGIQLVYGIESYDTYRVYAIYGDGRLVGMESLPVPGSAPEITAEQLKAVVVDPAMVVLFG